MFNCQSTYHKSLWNICFIFVIRVLPKDKSININTQDDANNNYCHHDQENIDHVGIILILMSTVKGEFNFLNDDFNFEIWLKRTIMSTFELLGAREMFDESKAARSIEGGADPASYLSIRLSNKSISREAARVLASFLHQCVNLKNVDISDIIAGRPEEEALEVMLVLSESLRGRQLEEINVSDNAIGEKGVPSITPLLLGQEQLKRLYVCNDGMSTAATHSVVDLLLFRAPTLLTTFHFHNNMSGDSGAEAIARLVENSPHLRDLRFSGTRTTQTGTLVVLKAIQKITTLERLDFADNVLSGENGAELAQAVSAQRGLTELIIRDCALGVSGLSELATALSTFDHSLTHLDLSGNDLDNSVSSLRSLFRILSKHSQVHHLSLDDDEIGTVGAIILSAILPRLTNLTHLNLNSCTIGSQGAQALLPAVCELFANHQKFQKIELNSNEISEGTIDAISVGLENAGLSHLLGPTDENMGDDEEELSILEGHYSLLNEIQTL